MRKLTAILLAAALALGAAACAKTSGNPRIDSPAETASPEPEATAASPVPTAPQQIDPEDKEDRSEGMSCYSEACDFYFDILTAMAVTGGEYIRLNNERVGDDTDDPSYLDVSYAPFVSLNMAVTAFVSDETTTEKVQESLEFYGFQDIEFEITAPGMYKISFDDESETGSILYYENLMRYENGSIRYELICNGETVDFEEFVSMGGGLFALQDMTNRAIVRYRDGTLISMHHSTLRSEFDFDTNALTSWSRSYDASADSIWGRTDLDTDWVDERNAAGDIYMIFDYADKIMYITGFRIIGFGEDAVFELRDPVVITK